MEGIVVLKTMLRIIKSNTDSSGQGPCSEEYFIEFLKAKKTFIEKTVVLLEEKWLSLLT